jgi:putative MATE family efflux protein
MAATTMIVDHRNVGAAFRRLSLPIAVGMLGDQLLGIVDTIAIGSLGTTALAGVTGASVVFIALLYGVAGFLSGLSIIGAQRIGAHDLDGFAKTVRAGMAVPLLVSALISAGSLALATPVMHALVGDLASVHASAQYLILRCFSMLPIVVSGSLIAGLGAAGNRKLGIIVLAIVNVIHIPLLLCLALGWWTHHPYGIAGAGVSSLLSETIAAIYACAYVARRPIYRVFSRLTLDWRLALRCARLGLPEAVFLLAVMAPDAVFIRLLAPLGPTAIAGFRALNVVSDLTFVVPSPLQSAVQTVIGQRLGARDVDGAEAFLRRSLRLTVAITTATGIAVAILAWPLAYIFTLNAAVASLATLPLILHMTTLPLKGWAMVSMAPIRASGDTKFSMTVGILFGVLVVPIAYVCIAKLHLGLFAVPIAWIVAWAARAVATALKLHDRSWTRRPPIAVG